MLPNFFDEPVAAEYDDDTDVRFTAEHLALEAGFLRDLAGEGGRALELAVGTGRVALPLAARGIEVHGIDLSEAMVAELRAKPGGDRIPVSTGDFATTRVDGEFDLVYLVFNTLGNVTTQDAQVDTFANAARHLRPGGAFVVEIGVPDLPRVDGGRFVVFHHGDEHTGVDEYDRATQAMWSHHYSREDDGTWRRASVPFRYVWPSELDLMARLAGMTLRERWSGWKQEPFTSESTKHVSVWEKPA